MAVDLVTQFLPLTDEKFTTESKTSILTNSDFKFTGAHTIKVYKISTSGMNDYDRAGTGQYWSRYGDIKGLDATTEEFTLMKDRSFTFAIDRLDTDETAQQLEAATALGRQMREVVIPEIDTYVMGEMCANAGIKRAAAALTSDNIFDEILKGNNALDNAEVPETQRVIVVTPDIYYMMKRSNDIILSTDIGADMRIKGVIGNLDGAVVLKVPANRLPADFGFMIVHPSATVAVQKLEDYRVHTNPPGISGSLVEGRFCYGAFILENKKNGIYYQPVATATQGGDTTTGKTK